MSEMLPKRQKCCVSRPTKRDISCQRTFFDMRTIEMERWWKQQFSMFQPSRRYHKTLCVYLLLALLCLPSFGLWVSVSAMQKKMWVRAKDRRSVLVNVFTTPSHIPWSKKLCFPPHVRTSNQDQRCRQLAVLLPYYASGSNTRTILRKVSQREH